MMTKGETLATRTRQVTNVVGEFIVLDNHETIYRERHLQEVTIGKLIYETLIENPFDKSVYTQYRLAY